MKRVIPAAQIKEWLDSPITELFKEVLQVELDECYRKRADLFKWGNPTETQENRAYVLGEEIRLADFIKLLSNDNEDGTVDLYFASNGVTIIEEESDLDDTDSRE